MIRRPPRSTPLYSSAASDVYKRQALPGLVRPVTDEIHFGERVGLIGPNGTGKTQLVRLLAGEPIAHSGEVVLGPRVSPGLFTQFNARTEFAGRIVLDVVGDRTGGGEASM